MIEKLLPVAKTQYADLEAMLGIKLFHSRNIIRALFNSREENDWLVRTGEPGYAKFMADDAEMEDFLENHRTCLQLWRIAAICASGCTLID